MTTVFICYSRSDVRFVDSLVTDLHRFGVSTWRDVDNIPSHISSNTKGWRSAIEDGLDKSNTMIVVISQASIGSQEVEAEWSYFLKRERPIFPVICQANVKSPYRLNVLQEWDLTSNYDSKIRQLVNKIKSHQTQIGHYPSPAGHIKPSVSTKKATQRPKLSAIGLLLAILSVICLGIICGYIGIQSGIGSIVGSQPRSKTEVITEVELNEQLAGEGLIADFQPGLIVFSGDIEGQSIEMKMTLEAVDGDLKAQIIEATVGGISVDASLFGDINAELAGSIIDDTDVTVNSVTITDTEITVETTQN